VLIPRFHLITPIVPLASLTALIAAGVDAIQIRDKGADDRALLDFARSAVDALRPLRAIVLINDRVDLALAAGADGVHLGAMDVPVAVARQLAPHLLIGATCRSLADAQAAAADGADYAGVGPVHATTTKTGLPDPLGTGGLAAAIGVLPVIAVGGIVCDRVPAALSAGAHGVAVFGGVAHAPDPPAAAKEIAVALRRSTAAA
jgi:thiamine-phosphate pyrophosphorylase